MTPTVHSPMSLVTPPPTKIVGVIARWAWLNLELESRACWALCRGSGAVVLAVAMADERRSKCANQLTNFSKNKKVLLITQQGLQLALLSWAYFVTSAYSIMYLSSFFPSHMFDAVTWCADDQPWPPHWQQDRHTDGWSTWSRGATGLRVPGRDGALWPGEDPWASGAC